MKSILEESKELIAYLNIHDNEIREVEGSQIKHRFMEAIVERDNIKELPDYMDISNKSDVEVLSPLEQFIHDHEPAGLEDSEKFRSGLLQILKTV